MLTPFGISKVPVLSGTRIIVVIVESKRAPFSITKFKFLGSFVIVFNGQFKNVVALGKELNLAGKKKDSRAVDLNTSEPK